VKAYVLSKRNGTVQIGNTVFQPCTGAIFKVGPIRKKDVLCVVDVPDKSMWSAREALQKAGL